MKPWKSHLTECIRSACRLEVLSPKPGNVSPGHSFADASADDFLVSADAVAPILADSHRTGVGPAIKDAVATTVEATGHNTNLGIILLLAPLAAVPPNTPLTSGIRQVLQSLTVEDAVSAYEAIAMASPGGLGKAPKQDVTGIPDQNLQECMRLAAERDLIAAQYANGFREVLQTGMWLLAHTFNGTNHLNWADHSDFRLAWVAVSMMATFGDSLIRRKCGDQTDREVRKRAHQLLQSGWPQQAGTDSLYDQFDAFLREDGHRRNPGTTADMIAAVLFAALRSGICRCENDRLEFVKDADVQSV